MNTGGALYFNTVVAGGVDGITGIAGGGTVFNYDDGSGWKRLGSLTGAVDAVPTLSPTLGPHEYYAQTAGGELWLLKPGATQWIDTKVALIPGSIHADEQGVVGIGAQGSVWQYSDTGQSTRVGTKTGVVALTPASNSSLQEELFAQVSDGSIWLATVKAGDPKGFADATWTPTYARLLPGTMERGGTGLIGIAADSNVWQYTDPAGWAGLAGLGGAIHVVSALNYDPGTISLNPGNPQPGVINEVFAQLADGSLWYYSLGTHRWVNTHGYFIG